ncbi:hypothetical protein WA026_015094 [Henosepilachna vigintioctopunctata]|uniref:Protein sleepless n=1 Tax=Henosepilachna vigintioctopunctata TaxID=420089 RepID=A0AAW1U877_9CUCU
MVCSRALCLNTVCALFFLGLGFVELGHAKNRQDTRRWVDKSIFCYECNSEYDPRCGDPFDNATIGIVNCSLKQKPEHIEDPPTLCRKTIQTVNGKVRIIRACGYITSDRDDQECVRKTGTHEVQIKYCSCTGSLCNGSLMHRLSSNVLILLAVVGLLGIIL